MLSFTLGDEKMEIKCQANVLFSTKGEIQPLWLRFKDEQGELHKLTVKRCRQTGFPLSTSIMFEITAHDESMEYVITVRFDKNTYEWQIIDIKS